MKRMLALGMIVIVVAFSVPVVPAFAGELSVAQGAPAFLALSALPDVRRGELAALTDEQLSAVEGTAFFCVVCVNSARIRQKNVSAFSFGTLQSNSAFVIQRNGN
jgi:hypothetical protein